MGKTSKDACVLMTLFVERPKAQFLSSSFVVASMIRRPKLSCRLEPRIVSIVRSDEVVREARRRSRDLIQSRTLLSSK